MISFKAFVNAINDAIISANERLVQENLNLLDEFFVRADKDTSQEAEESEDIGNDGDKLRAKSVIVNYPGPSGNEVEVQVPLITLVPITGSKIDKVKMSADFQMRLVDDELQLDFPKKSGEPDKGSIFSKKKARISFGRLEITIRPSDAPDGLDSLIEGYEKALKSQIPN